MLKGVDRKNHLPYYRISTINDNMMKGKSDFNLILKIIKTGIL